MYIETTDVGLTLLVGGRHAVVLRNGLDAEGRKVAELEYDPLCGECNEPMRFVLDPLDYHSDRKWRCPNGHAYDLFEIEELVRSR